MNKNWMTQKPLKHSAWSGIFLIILYIPILFFSIILRLREPEAFSPQTYLFPVIILFVLIILNIIFLYGFVILGNKFKNKFLVFSAQIGIIINVLINILIIYLVLTNLTQIATSIYSYSYIFSGIILILLGIGLLGVSKKIKYAKIAGILSIIAGVTYWIFIGYIISFVVLVFEILIFFNTSKKFEK